MKIVLTRSLEQHLALLGVLTMYKHNCRWFWAGGRLESININWCGARFVYQTTPQGASFWENIEARIKANMTAAEIARFTRKQMV